MKHLLFLMLVLPFLAFSAAAQTTKISPQSQFAGDGAVAGQVLKWTGSEWAPANDGGLNNVSVSAPLMGDGTAANPLGLAPGTAPGALLTWDGTAWAPITPTTTNALANPSNTISSTVNGVVATAPAVNTVTNTLSALGNLTTAVNGVAAVPLALPRLVGAPDNYTLRYETDSAAWARTGVLQVADNLANGPGQTVKMMKTGSASTDGFVTIADRNTGDYCLAVNNDNVLGRSGVSIFHPNNSFFNFYQTGINGTGMAASNSYGSPGNAFTYTNGIIDHNATRHQWRLSSNATAGMSFMPSATTGGLTIGNTSMGANAVSRLNAEATGSTAYVAQFANTNGTAGSNAMVVMAGQNAFTATSTYISFRRPDNTEIGSIRQLNTGNISYLSTSDERFKTDVVDSDKGLKLLLQMRPVNWTWLDKINGKKIKETGNGFIAQEMFKIYADAVSPGDDTTTWGIDYGKLVPVLVKAIQEQQVQIEELKAKIGGNNVAAKGFVEPAISISTAAAAYVVKVGASQSIKLTSAKGQKITFNEKDFCGACTATITGNGALQYSIYIGSKKQGDYTGVAKISKTNGKITILPQ